MSIDPSPPASNKRLALLIGAPAPDLRGVGRDLALMREGLERHDFGVQTLANATRERLDQALLGLIANSQAGDSIILYYSGHGARFEGAERAQLGERSPYRFLVMSDFADSSEDDFRGYTSTELSLRLSQLTDKTPNVTVIMDCCFSGRIFRAEGDRSEATIEWQSLDSGSMPTRFHEPKGKWKRGAERFHAAFVAREAEALARRHPEANPHAVQLLAAAAKGVAYELEINHQGHRDFAGAMTWVLYRQLLTVDPTRTTWQDLGRLMRQTPVRRGPNQTISIEGPYRRLMFSLTEREEIGAVDAEYVDGELRLAGGWLAGLREGDAYEFIRRRDRRVLGRGQLTRVSSSCAISSSTIIDSELEHISSARPIRHAHPRGCVELVGFEGPTRAFARELARARFETSNFLQVWLASHSTSPPYPIVARLVLDQGKLRLHSSDRAFGRPRDFDPAKRPDQARSLMEHLADGARRLARAAMLRALPSQDRGEFDGDEAMRWRWVEDGQLAAPLPTSGLVLQPDSHIALELYARQDLHVSVLSVRADGRIELLSRAQGGGVEVSPNEGEPYVLGKRSFGPIRGIGLTRPPSSIVSDSEALGFTVLTVLSDRQVDLRSWEQAGIRRYVPSDPLAPPSTTRNLASPSRPASAHFRIETLELTLAPSRSQT